MHRDDTSIGAIDAGYPKSIDVAWNPGNFAAGGADAVLYSGVKVSCLQEPTTSRSAKGIWSPF